MFLGTWKYIFCKFYKYFFNYLYLLGILLHLLNNNGMNISKSLVELRKRVNLKQTQAANIIGISQTYLSQIESGNKEPSTTLLQDICKAYGVPAPILYFKSLTIDDVPKEKQRTFKELHPLITNLIDQIF